MKKQFAKVEGHTTLVREESSQAIVNTDVESYRLVMRRREVMRTQRTEINTLKQEVTEIKVLLRNIIERTNGQDS
jgi:hypothetical protein